LNYFKIFMNNKPDVGDRVVLKPKSSGIGGTRRGKIAFKGFLTDKEYLGIMYGVSLDRPLGKHNGTYKGRQYFKCEPMHGVLVREESIIASTKSDQTYESTYSRDYGQNDKYYRSSRDISNSRKQWSPLKEVSSPEYVDPFSSHKKNYTSGMKYGLGEKFTDSMYSTNPSSDEVLFSPERSHKFGIQKPSPTKKVRKRGTRGLQNLGNTCYFNAVMQCLLQVAQLKLVLLESSEITDDLILTSALRDFFREMNSKQNQHSFNPQHLFQALCLLPECSHYPEFQQQDSRELLGFLLDGINDEMESKIPALLFQGRLQSIIKCLSCDTISTSEEPFWTLPVDLVSRLSSHSGSSYDLDKAASKKTYSLEGLLRSFTEIESLSGENLYECDKCNAKVLATKQFKISSAPNTLIVHIKRFFHNDKGGKLDNFVQFQKELSLTDACTDKNSCSSYYIRAIVVHRGKTLSSGHYVAYARTIAKPWVEFDDRKCTVVNWDYVKKQNAYLLFYDQVVLNE